MSMEQKQCLFCEKMVFTSVNSNNKRNLYHFRNCRCSGENEYLIEPDDYDILNALPTFIKRERFYLISGYIREMLEIEKNSLQIHAELADQILESSLVPQGLGQKMDKIIGFLFRQTKSPDEIVHVDPISEAYNLSYSPNLQEFIYVVEELKGQKLINRMGSKLSLTEKGWERAVELAMNPAAQSCMLVLSHDSEWSQSLRYHAFQELNNNTMKLTISEETANIYVDTEDWIEKIRDSDWIIIDLTEMKPEFFFAAGMAVALDKKLILSMHSDWEKKISPELLRLAPMIWENPDQWVRELTERLQSEQMK